MPWPPDFLSGAHRISKALLCGPCGNSENRARSDWPDEGRGKSEGGGHVDVAVERRRKPLREPAVVLVRRNTRNQLRLRHLRTQPATIQSANLQLNGGTDLTRKGSRFLPYRAHGGNPASARDRPAQPVLPTPCAVAMTRLARVVAHINQALGLQKRITLRLRSA